MAPIYTADNEARFIAQTICSWEKNDLSAFGQNVLFYYDYWLFTLPGLLSLVLGLLPLVYLWLALKRFYARSWRKTILKGIGVVALFLFVVFPVAIGLVGLYAFLYY